ncbi:hypothetical protein GMDG_08181 [Pseudogymnoascus destructans 20631-21]|uniref:Phosducin domain-containing protein n=1 Tax=Pseudogymnoascus destructans (strain ATCC MYA-4855 / 20631-21) TaxID=658429 RepID=L8G1C8_PSED2|nr:hypothetical protein GMDG_08181 [Pseudogymnoascus destructans 20631-21]
MTAQTPAQEEFQAMLDKAWFGGAPSDRHPEDANGGADEIDEADEEARHREQQMEEAMRAPSEEGGVGEGGRGGGEEALEEDEEFLEKWREERRRELERDGSDIRNRRTSPSVRRFGRFDEVDALGYLDAIEKVGWETVVVVFVYDIECAVSQVIEEALTPLVATHPEIHFVKVHYDDIEFDNAGVPAMLAYKQQGELFANLTYIIDQIPEDTNFDTQALKNVLRKHKVL